MTIGALIIVAALVAFVLFQVGRAGVAARQIERHWADLNNEPIRNNQIQIVALGGSEIQGIGADSPENTLVGRIETYVEDRTGKQVVVRNFAAGGAGSQEIIQQQLSRIDSMDKVDLFIISVSNDMQRSINRDDQRASLDTLFRILPSDRIIISDLPLMPGREPYQEVLSIVADKHRVLRADFAKVFTEKGRRLDVFSWLPPHVSSFGYQLWFEAFKPRIDTIINRGSFE